MHSPLAILPGAVAGSEARGTVEAVGEGVDAAMIGMRVEIAGTHGGWAEYFTVPANGVLPLPDTNSDVVGAQQIATHFQCAVAA